MSIITCDKLWSSVWFVLVLNGKIIDYCCSSLRWEFSESEASTPSPFSSAFKISEHWLWICLCGSHITAKKNLLIMSNCSRWILTTFLGNFYVWKRTFAGEQIDLVLSDSAFEPVISFLSRYSLVVNIKWQKIWKRSFKGQKSLIMSCVRTYKLHQYKYLKGCDSRVDKIRCLLSIHLSLKCWPLLDWREELWWFSNYHQAALFSQKWMFCQKGVFEAEGRGNCACEKVLLISYSQISVLQLTLKYGCKYLTMQNALLSSLLSWRNFSSSLW